jgi:hypothetical protein
MAKAATACSSTGTPRTHLPARLLARQRRVRAVPGARGLRLGSAREPSRAAGRSRAWGVWGVWVGNFSSKMKKMLNAAKKSGGLGGLRGYVSYLERKTS